VRLFNIILSYVTDVLNTEFKHDGAIMNDERMRKFLAFCLNDIKVPGFPVVKTLSEYARVIATIIWTVSGFHSMTFCAEAIDSYIPFRPTCVQRPFPLDASSKDIPFA
jgi:hypothetical protein